MRLMCKGKSTPIKHLYDTFNKETQDGRKMNKYSKLLESSIGSIISVKEEKEVESLFSVGETSALTSNIKGLDDFELICWDIVTSPSTPGSWISSSEKDLKPYMESTKDNKTKLVIENDSDLLDNLNKFLL